MYLYLTVASIQNTSFLLILGQYEFTKLYLLLQVANYGIGGFYESHQDPMFVYKEPDFLVHSVQETNPAYVTGDRLGTFMLYLSEVRIKRFFSRNILLFK